MFYIVFHGVFLTKTSVFSEKSVNFNFLVAALDGGGDVVNDDHDDMERPIPPPPLGSYCVPANQWSQLITPPSLQLVFLLLIFSFL